jgi:hypothetical protein
MIFLNIFLFAKISPNLSVCMSVYLSLLYYSSVSMSFFFICLSLSIFMSLFSSLCKLLCMHISLCILPISISLFSLFLPSSYVCKFKYVVSIKSPFLYLSMLFLFLSHFSLSLFLAVSLYFCPFYQFQSLRFQIR